MGHDTDRPYVVVAVVSGDFVLCADGKYRTLGNPKQKRIKHLKTCGVSEAAAKAIASGKLTDAQLRKILETVQAQ
ncbi:MAG: RNA-binding protein [Clostridiales bacterium]|nr:RNA-binding protein [Clostridiales bacterium]